MEEQTTGRLEYFGLKNGQTICVLTEQPWDFDGPWLVVTTTKEEEIRINAEEIAYTRSKEVPIPTEDEINAAYEKLLGMTTPEQVRKDLGIDGSPYL